MSIAMGTYMLGCLLAGFAQSIEALTIFRGIAGAGGGGGGFAGLLGSKFEAANKDVEMGDEEESSSGEEDD